MSRFAFERAIKESGLPAPARHIALTLATWADVNTCVIPNRFMPSLAKLVETTGLGKSTIARYLIVLEEDGWIGRLQRKGKSATHNEVTHYTLHIPAGAQAEEEAEEVVPERDKGRPTAGQEVVPERDKGRPTAGHSSSLSSGSTYQSPRVGASEHDSDRSGDHRNGSTKKPNIKSDLDAAADAAREELGKATRRQIRPEWARKVAMSILDAARSPISDGRHAAYVRTAIRNETDLSRFLPTPTATSSHTQEAFLPDPADDTPTPPALTLHTTPKPRPRRGPAQPPLLAPVADQPPLPDELTDPITTAAPDTVHSYADQIRATLARRASGDTQ